MWEGSMLLSILDFKTQKIQIKQKDLKCLPGVKYWEHDKFPAPNKPLSYQLSSVHAILSANGDSFSPVVADEGSSER